MTERMQWVIVIGCIIFAVVVIIRKFVQWVRRLSGKTETDGSSCCAPSSKTHASSIGHGDEGCEKRHSRSKNNDDEAGGCSTCSADCIFRK